MVAVVQRMTSDWKVTALVSVMSAQVLRCFLNKTINPTL